jgi:hypothetical protein
VYSLKKIYHCRAIISLLVAAILFVACHRSDETSIEKQHIVAAAQGYLDAMANYDVDAAIPYSSKETREGTIPFFKTMIAKTDSTYIRNNTPASVHIDSVRLQPGDSTAVAFFTKTTPVQKKHQQLNLIKRDGTWQAHVITAVPQILKPHRPLTNQDIKKMGIKKVIKGAPSSYSDEHNK